MELTELQARQQFVELVVSGELNIMKMAEEQLVEKLDAIHLLKRNGSYDYLLGMPVRTLTADNAAKIAQRCAAKKAERDMLLQMTPESMWTTELEELEKAYTKVYT